jgi:hypothetical protein
MGNLYYKLLIIFNHIGESLSEFVDILKIDMEEGYFGSGFGVCFDLIGNIIAEA